MANSIVSKNKPVYLFSFVPAGFVAGFSGRRFNVGFDQEEAKVKESRTKILSGLNIGLNQLVCANQVHDENVVIITKNDKSKGSVKRADAISSCDAMITKEKNIALGILTADCLPVFLIDKDKEIIAIAHCGWKGTGKSIVKKTIFIMKDIFQSQPRSILAYFGPAIRKCCYEVGQEFLNYFKRGIVSKNEKIFLDLIEINRLQLKESGVLEENIFDCQICTSCQNDKFFSYRKEGESCGRQLSIIVRKE